MKGTILDKSKFSEDHDKTSPDPFMFTVRLLPDRFVPVQIEPTELPIIKGTKKFKDLRRGITIPRKNRPVMDPIEERESLMSHETSFQKNLDRYSSMVSVIKPQ